MYWKVNFSEYRSHLCINCCKALIEKEIDIVKKEYNSIIIKTDMPYTDILNICLRYDVINIIPCHMKNFKERIMQEWETMKNKQK